MIILSQITTLPNQDQRLNTQNALGTIIYNEQDHNRCLINILATATREGVCMGEGAQHILLTKFALEYAVFKNQKVLAKCRPPNIVNISPNPINSLW